MTLSRMHGIPITKKYQRKGVDMYILTYCVLACRNTGTRVNVHLAKRQSIIPFTISILFRIEKLMKLVSTIILYGGPSAVLCLKNSAVGYFSLQCEVVRGIWKLKHLQHSRRTPCTYTLRTLFLSSRFDSSALRLVVLDSWIQNVLGISDTYCMTIKSSAAKSALNLQSRVLGAQHSLHLREFSSSFGLPLYIHSITSIVSKRIFWHSCAS